MIPDLEQVKKDGRFEFQFISKDGKINEKRDIIFVNSEKIVANGGFCKIKVGKLFFTKFNNKKEQIAILWHEFGHRWTCLVEGILIAGITAIFFKYFSTILTFSLIFMLILISILLFILFIIEIIFAWTSELFADNYSASKNSIDDCLQMLKIIKEMYTDKTVPYKFWTHPPIDLRIKKIQKLKKDLIRLRR